MKMAELFRLVKYYNLPRFDVLLLNQKKSQISTDRRSTGQAPGSFDEDFYSHGGSLLSLDATFPWENPIL